MRFTKINGSPEREVAKGLFRYHAPTTWQLYRLVSGVL